MNLITRTERDIIHSTTVVAVAEDGFTATCFPAAATMPEYGQSVTGQGDTAYDAKVDMGAKLLAKMKQANAS